MAGTCVCSVPPLSLLPLPQQQQLNEGASRREMVSQLGNNKDGILSSFGFSHFNKCAHATDLSLLRGEGVFSFEHKNDSGNLGRRESLLALVCFGMTFGQDIAIPPLASFGSEEKKKNLLIDDIKNIIENDIKIGQYYVTGKLTRSIYDDKCRFIDPTTNIEGLDKYIVAVTQLFDPKASKQQLLSIEVTSPKTIKAYWRLGGFLKFPWRPFIRPYEGSTVYSLDEEGLIVRHDETWNISILTAFLEFMSPSWLMGSEEQLFQNFL